MMVADSTLIQRWERHAGGYILVDETVGGGDPRILEAPEPEDDVGVE
jgi:hypothetical protein